MKPIYYSFAALLIANASYAMAQDPNPSNVLQLPTYMQQEAASAPATPALAPITDNVQLDAAIRDLQISWADIKYRTPETEQEAKMAALMEKAKQLVASYPNYAEPKIWAAIITSTQAGIKGGLGALGLAKQALNLLQEAEKINPNALEGSIYTSLGSLFYKVPGWPLGFGDNDKARAYLEQARAINPNGIDPNYFYGDFLIKQGEYDKAVPVLEQALRAPARPGREVADVGRRQEIQDDLANAKKKIGN